MSTTALTAPRVAWPTLALLAGALATWVAGLALGGVLGFAACTVAAYAAFTPLHEAAHRVIARPRWVNEVCGRLASVTLLGPFAAIRYIHLEHHKHTNDPVADPDHWSGRGPRALLPLRWLTQDLHYYVVYVRRARPTRERVEVAVVHAATIALLIGLAVMGHGWFVLAWVGSARLAIGILAFAFDYLPHRPHQVTSKQDRYAATSAFPGPIKYVLSLGQSMHLVHHLYPGVPFYRYGAVWRETMTSFYTALTSTRSNDL